MKTGLGREVLSISEVKMLLKVNRSQLKAITAVLTGHSLVNYHQCYMRLSDGPMCIFYDEIPETFEHIICQSDVFSHSTLRVLGN